MVILRSRENIMSDNKTTNRSKLTLKLPTSAKSTLTLNRKNSSRLDNRGIEVTIKGRKKEDSKTEYTQNDEIKKRFNAISESTDHSLNNKQFNLKQKIQEELKREEIQKDEDYKAKYSAENKGKDEGQSEGKDQITQSTVNNDTKSEYTVDSFDIRKKIKQSLDESKKEEEEKNKILEARKEEIKKTEEEKLEKEKSFKKQKNDKYGNNYSDENDTKNNKKSSFKNERLSKRKLTYIIDSDDDNFRRRKKNKIKTEDFAKDYKKITKDVDLPDLITVSDLADRMSEKAGDVVKKLFSMGMVVTSNQAIDAETAEIIVEEFGHNSKRVSYSDVENVLQEDVSNFELKPRAPVVTIMGHVDHGKTSLLDSMRKTDIVSGEHGGITQHIGASRIKTKNGKYITFLDTPGHQAFTEMRSRGANITDIVVLVVAADDGVKEQTIEAINHAKAAKVPIIVAVNKIDKPGADPSRVTNELLSHDIISEDMGGESMFVEVSAKEKLNLDKLEEAILLQAEMLELKAAYEGKSSGTVIESRIDPSRGVVASLLVEKGSLDLSDLIIVGTSFGKVRKMTDDNNKNIKIATPSMPVEILGLDQAPSSGDKFIEVDEERQAREIISYRQRKEKERKDLKASAKSIGDIFKESGASKIKNLNVIIKADVHGSMEAINGSIIKLNTEEVAVKPIHLATGGITDSDVSLASASSAIILGFNTRANLATRELAASKNIEIRYYSIIYDLVDDLKGILSGMLDPVKSEKYLGQAEIREVFKVSGSGKIAGCFVIDGVIKRNAKARLLRDNVVIFDGILKTVKRFKEDVKEVKSNFECGLSFENYEDIKQGDSIECYEITEKQRSI